MLPNSSYFNDVIKIGRLIGCNKAFNYTNKSKNRDSDKTKWKIFEGLVSSIPTKYSNKLRHCPLSNNKCVDKSTSEIPALVTS